MFLLFWCPPSMLLIIGSAAFGLAQWKQLKAGKDGDPYWQAASAFGKAAGLFFIGTAILLAIWANTSLLQS